MKRIRVGSGSAYWGDALEPAVEMVKYGNLDYIGFDHLAELTMAQLHKQRQRDPNKGYIQDIIPFMDAILPIAHEKGVKVITNAGGANPKSAAQEVIRIANKHGLKGIKVGVVYGDDVTDKIDFFLEKGYLLTNMDTGDTDIRKIKERIVSAYAYIGAEGIVEALKKGADVIVTGRVSDSALYIGPMMYEFGWDYSEEFVDKLGAAITIGHIIECSACSTGGMSNMWKQAPEMWRVGFPIAEVDETGRAVITKIEQSGGLVNEWTIKEHLLYEIQDPSNYIMPDGIADFTTLKLREIGPNQVEVTNMSGKPRPKDLKVCIGYEDGWIGEGFLLFPWPDALERAKKAEEIFINRLKIVGVEPEEMRIDYVGVNALHGSAAPSLNTDLNEVGLRIVVKTATFEEAEKARREVTHLWTFGPVGTAFGVPMRSRKVVALWPTLIPREEVQVQTEIWEVTL